MTASAPFPAPAYLNAWVIEFHDGDTGLFRVDRWMRDYSTWSVRLIGCGARELADPGGREARDALTARLPAGTPVVLGTAKPDKYGGRIDARVYYTDRVLNAIVDLSEVLIAEQWAARWNGVGVQPKPPWPRTTA